MKRLPNAGASESLESWLASEDPGKLKLADEAFARLAPDEVIAYLTKAILLEEKRRLTSGGMWMLSGLLSLGAVDYLWALLLVRIGWPKLSLANFALPVLLVCSLHGSKPSRFERACVLRLAHLHDRRTIPLLLELAAKTTDIERCVVGRSLIRLIPTMEPADLDELSKPQRKALFTMMQPEKNPSMKAEIRRELARTILITLTRLNEADALPAVRSVVRRKTKTPEDVEFQQTAGNCLTLLHYAAEERNAQAIRR